MTCGHQEETTTGFFVRSLIACVRNWWTLDAVCWLLFHTWPILSGLLAKVFFDLLEGKVAVGLNVPTVAALAAALGLTRAGIVVVASVAGGQQRFRTRVLLWHNLLRRILSLPGARALPGTVGDAISTIRDDVGGSCEALDLVFDAVAAAVFACGALAILLAVDRIVTFIVFAPIAVVVGAAHAVRASLATVRERSREATAQVTGAIGEAFAACQAVQVAGADERVVAYIRTLSDERRKAALRDRMQVLCTDAVFREVADLGAGLVLLATAAKMRSGVFTVGNLALFGTYLTQLTDFAGFLGYLVNSYRHTGVNFRRMVQLLQGAPASDLVARCPIPLSGGSTRLVPLAPPVHPVPPAPPSADSSPHLETLEVRHLTCRHPGSERGIHDVSFELKRGSLTVVTGRIGSGKTTLLRAVLGLLPAESGDVLWNGRSLDTPAEFLVPPRVAYTPQTPVLLSGTLRDNITLGRPACGRVLERAVLDAVLTGDIAELAQGLDTAVGVRGMRLSGGQVRRTAVARMYVCEPELYVCDDIAGGLDSGTERLLWRRALRRGGTWLVVSHNPQVLAAADQVIVLEEGRVAYCGRRQDGGSVEHAGTTHVTMKP
jgi:ATP-binding cassette subfamily B protein